MASKLYCKNKRGVFKLERQSEMARRFESFTFRKKKTRVLNIEKTDMARESTVARESSVNTINAVSPTYSPRTMAHRTATSYVNDAVIRRGTSLMSLYANTSPFSPSKNGPRNEQEERNLQRISNAVSRMRRRNKGFYF